MDNTQSTKKDFLVQKDLEQLKRLGDLYTQAKGLILYSEEIDPTARSNIQVIKELRDAFDHLMRVVAASLCDARTSGANAPDYCYKNIDKAIGHVYRAAFDALDGTVLSLRQKIVEVLEGYPQAVIKEVMPDYWEFRKKLELLTKNIASHRAAKDVAGDLGETLSLYVSDIEEIKGLYSRINSCGETLDECLAAYEKERKAEHKKDLKVHVLGGLGYTIIGGVGVLALVALGCDPKDAVKNFTKSGAEQTNVQKLQPVQGDKHPAKQ
jgi:hypothetical protein